MEVTIRPANESDIDIIVEFSGQLYEDDPASIDLPPFEARLVHTALAQLIQNSRLGQVWLINDRDEPIGYVVLTLGFSLEYHGQDAFIDEIFIKASHRGKGVGTKVMEFVEAASRELGINALHLEVERANVPAQNLYRKVGFEDHDRYLMTKLIK